MSKTIMISGPHAIGKSTTAEKLAEKHTNFLYVNSFASKIAKDMGYDLNNNPEPEQILEYQWRVLRAFQMHYEATLETDTIYDRSPLDFAVYTVMQLQKFDTYGKYVEEAAKYVKECIKTTNGYCDLLVIPEADLEAAYEDKPNRPSFSDEQISYRMNYQRILKLYADDAFLVEQLNVPADKQYDDRVAFISEHLGVTSDEV